MGETAAGAADLFSQVYDELRRLAAAYMRRERQGHTLQATALVHEAYLSLAGESPEEWRDQGHFLGVAARAMRQLLVQHARGRGRAKRGGDWRRVTLDAAADPLAGGDLEPEELLALDAALGKLERLDERQARIVELRFFAGLSVAEAARELGVSKRTAEGDWAHARAWLKRELARRDPG